MLFGPGDPAADIRIDEQSVVCTIAYAKNVGIWPRKPEEPADPEPDRGKPDQPDETRGDKPDADVGAKPIGGHPVGMGPSSFTAEGVLREALVRLWEQARAKKVVAIGALTIRIFEAGDAFRLLGAVGAVSGAEKRVTMTGGYETREGGSFELEFQGPVPDAQPVREFLEPQLRDASSRTLQAGFQLTFADGLSMQGDAAEQLAEQLTRFARGAAYVSATAEAKT